MTFLIDRRLDIDVPSPNASAPKLRMSPKERALQKVLTSERLAAAAPVLWGDLLVRCRCDHRTPSARREWLEFRRRSIVKRVARSGVGHTPAEIARGLKAVTAAHFLRDDVLDGVEALCNLHGHR